MRRIYGLGYDLSTRHPLLGRRMPDLDLVTGSRTTEAVHCRPCAQLATAPRCRWPAASVRWLGHRKHQHCRLLRRGAPSRIHSPRQR